MCEIVLKGMYILYMFKMNESYLYRFGNSTITGHCKFIPKVFKAAGHIILVINFLSKIAFHKKSNDPHIYF